MLNWKSSWPQPQVGGTNEVLWGWGTLLETQTRLWNHALDANRSFWSFYMPWIQPAPLVWTAAIAPGGPERSGTEPPKTVDGVPDALESQMRSWNHFLDANRSFWLAFADGEPTSSPVEATVSRKKAGGPREAAAARPPTASVKKRASRSR